jgi:hypothetical protein
MLRSLFPELLTRSDVTASIFLSDGSVSLKSQKPAGGGSWIKTLPTIASAANALDVAAAIAKASRIKRPNVTTKARIVSALQRLD